MKSRFFLFWRELRDGPLKSLKILSWGQLRFSTIENSSPVTGFWIMLEDAETVCTTQNLRPTLLLFHVRVIKLGPRLILTLAPLRKIVYSTHAIWAPAVCGWWIWSAVASSLPRMFFWEGSFSGQSPIMNFRRIWRQWFSLSFLWLGTVCNKDLARVGI